MSYQQVKIVFEKEIPASTPSLKITKTLILVALAEYSNEQGTDNVWPSIPRLAHKVGCSERHTQRVVSELRDVDGVLVPKGQLGSGTYSYRFDWSVYKTKASYEPPTRDTWKPGFVMQMTQTPKAVLAQTPESGHPDPQGGVTQTPEAYKPSITTTSRHLNHHKRKPAKNATSEGKKDKIQPSPDDNGSAPAEDFSPPPSDEDIAALRARVQQRASDRDYGKGWGRD